MFDLSLTLIHMHSLTLLIKQINSESFSSACSVRVALYNKELHVTHHVSVGCTLTERRPSKKHPVRVSLSYSLTHTPREKKTLQYPAC